MNFKKSLVYTLIFVFLFGFIFADTNGIWHRAEDVRYGIFGSDEGGGDFGFSNNLNVNNNLNVGNSLNVTNNLIVKNGNIGIGVNNPTVKLDVAGDIKANNIYSNNQLVATKTYVDSKGSVWQLNGVNVYYTGGNVGIGTNEPSSDLDVNGTITGKYLCIGDECRSSWPVTANGMPPGYVETLINSGEDTYTSFVSTTSSAVDSCNGNKNSGYGCSLTDDKVCNDVLIDNCPFQCYDGGDSGTYSCCGTAYNIRTISCKVAKYLVKVEPSASLEKTYTGTATITARDYSGSSEKCWVSFTSPSCNWDLRSPTRSEWTDALCKKWVEESIQYSNYCPNLGSTITSVNWALSGSSGTVTVKYY